MHYIATFSLHLLTYTVSIHRSEFVGYNAGAFVNRFQVPEVLYAATGFSREHHTGALLTPSGLSRIDELGLGRVIRGVSGLSLQHEDMNHPLRYSM